MTINNQSEENKKPDKTFGCGLKTFFAHLARIIFRAAVYVFAQLKKIKLDARDVHAYLGTILLAVGCYMIYPPASYISAGIVLLFIALKRW